MRRIFANLSPEVLSIDIAETSRLMPRGSASALPAWEAPIGYSDPKEEAALSSLKATEIAVATLT